VANREDPARLDGDGVEGGARRGPRGVAGRTVRGDGRTARGGARRDVRPERRRGEPERRAGEADARDAAPRSPVNGPADRDRRGTDGAGRRGGRPRGEDGPLRRDRDRSPAERKRPHRTSGDRVERAGGERGEPAWPARPHRRRDQREAARSRVGRPTRGGPRRERAPGAAEPVRGEAGPRRPEAPPLPEGLNPRSLDREVREQLRSLARGIAEQVALRLVATGELLDVDPEAALAHATVARRLASRIPAVREAVGLAAYRAGEWKTAIGELRAYHRMSGRLSHLAVLADCERALGRPERAIDIFRTVDRSQLSPEEAAELLIVAAGARADLGQREAAAAMLQVPQLSGTQPWVARLRYAYADALLALGRTAEAREWFSRAVDLDPEATTDAAERLLELEGVVIDEAEETDTEETDTEESAGGEPEDREREGREPEGREAAGGEPGDTESATGETDGGDPGSPRTGPERPDTQATGPRDGEPAGSDDAAVGDAGDRGYSGDGANPGTAVGGVDPANTMSHVEGAVAYDDDDLEDFDDDDDLDDEDLEDFDDLDDEDIDDDDDDLEDDEFDDDEFDDDGEFDDEDDDFDDDDLEDDDLDDDEFDDDDFDDDEVEDDESDDGEGDGAGARSPR